MLRRYKLPRAFQRESDTTGFKRRPFIFPTGFGFLFGVLAFIQLVMAISSQNNLIYLFVLSEISVAMTSMFFTNYNVYRCYLKNLSHDDLFANETNWIHVELGSHDRQLPQQMSMRWIFSKEEFFFSEQLKGEIAWQPRRRGWQKIPRLNIESRFPFSLLRSWKIVRYPGEVLVFPERKGKEKFPESSLDRNNIANHGLFRDLRSFQNGDSLRRIDWRATQRLQHILVRRFEENESTKLDFTWEQTSHITDTEARISQLALWISLAEKSLEAFELTLPNWSSGVGKGKDHAKICYTHLATWHFSKPRKLWELR